MWLFIMPEKPFPTCKAPPIFPHKFQRTHAYMVKTSVNGRILNWLSEEKYVSCFPQLAFTCSELTTETPVQYVKSV